MSDKFVYVDNGNFKAREIAITGEPVWAAPVVELPASNTVYIDEELPELVFDYVGGNLDIVSEKET